MNPLSYLVPLVFFIATGTAVLYLLKRFRFDRQLIAILGLFFMAMGIFLLVLDLVLITFTHGPQHILDYLLFNRLVSDAGFAGRWVLTAYLFITTGISICIYLLVKNLVRMLNTKKGSNP